MREWGLGCPCGRRQGWGSSIAGAACGASRVHPAALRRPPPPPPRACPRPGSAWQHGTKEHIAIRPRLNPAAVGLRSPEIRRRLGVQTGRTDGSSTGEVQQARILLVRSHRGDGWGDVCLRASLPHVLPGISMNESRLRAVSPRSLAHDSARGHRQRRLKVTIPSPERRSLAVCDDWQATGYGGTVKRIKSVEEKIAESATLDDAAKATVQEREVRDCRRSDLSAEQRQPSNRRPSLAHVLFDAEGRSEPRVWLCRS